MKRIGRLIWYILKDMWGWGKVIVTAVLFVAILLAITGLPGILWGPIVQEYIFLTIAAVVFILIFLFVSYLALASLVDYLRKAWKETATKPTES